MSDGNGKITTDLASSQTINSVEETEAEIVVVENRDDASPISLAGHLYVVYLCNRSNWVATHVIDEEGNASPIRPPISRTCSSDYQTCFNEGKFVPMLTTQCDSRAFTFALRVVHPSGISGDTQRLQISPSCGYRGEVVHMAIPDP